MLRLRNPEMLALAFPTLSRSYDELMREEERSCFVDVSLEGAVRRGTAFFCSAGTVECCMTVGKPPVVAKIALRLLPPGARPPNSVLFTVSESLALASAFQRNGTASLWMNWNGTEGCGSHQDHRTTCHPLATNCQPFIRPQVSGKGLLPARVVADKLSDSKISAIFY